MRELEAIIDRSFSDSIARNGYIHPAETAEEIVANLHIPQKYTRQLIEHGIRFHPTAEHLYPDVTDFFDTILSDTTNRVDLFTDDYLDRIASSGIGDFRRTLSYADRQRFGVLSDREDKVASLHEGIDITGFDHFVLVDDREQVLYRAKDLFHTNDHSPQLVYMDRKNRGSSNGFVYAHSFKALPIKLMQSNTHWLIDFNGVCIDDEGYRLARQQTVFSLLDILSD